MSWLKPSDILSSKRLWVLGEKTLVENYEEHRARWQKGQGTAPDFYGPRHLGYWPPGWKPGDAKRVVAEPVDLAGTLELHLTRVGIPPRLAQVLQAGPKETPALAAVREWSRSGKSILLLHGDPDTGKSCAAAAAFLERKRARWLDGQAEWDSDGLFIDAVDVAANLFTDDTKALIEFLGKAGLVVIDELGVETQSAPWQSTLDSVLHHRFNNPKLRTVLATNVSARREKLEEPSPFEQRYGARIARRIRESGTVFAADKAWRQAA